MTEKLTLKDAKQVLNELDISITRKPDVGEYRINFMGGREETAYYTNDLKDALATGIIMAKEKSVIWGIIDPTVDLGYLPSFLDMNDPQSAREQFNAKYQGGWLSATHLFRLDLETMTLYDNLPESPIEPRDPPMKPRAAALFRNEKIYLYQFSWVVVLQPDNSWDVARMS